MPWYPGDYQRDTQHLSTQEHGAYRLLIDACWCCGGALPTDDADLARITHLQPNEWQAMRPRIAKFFQSDNGEWKHKRVTAELDKAKTNAQRQSERTEAARRALQTKRQAVTMSVTENVTISPSPSPSPSPSSLSSPAPSPSKKGGAGGQVEIKELPEKIRTARMVQKWGVWQNVRRGMKKPKSWLLLFNEQTEWLGRFEEPIAFEILSSSIRNGYQGLFEPKGNNAKTNAQSSRSSDGRNSVEPDYSKGF
jgi:uncharacterized protein YdaU (DUF1376 family)